MRKKGLIALMTFCIAAGMLSGCASKESEGKNSGGKGSAITETQMGNSAKDDSAKKSKLNIGDYVLFGSYEQDNDTTNGAEPIEWQVVDIDNDKAWMRVIQLPLLLEPNILLLIMTMLIMEIGLILIFRMRREIFIISVQACQAQA